LMPIPSWGVDEPVRGNTVWARITSKAAPPQKHEEVETDHF
jgi:hypothetical protein